MAVVEKSILEQSTKVLSTRWSTWNKLCLSH